VNFGISDIYAIGRQTFMTLSAKKFDLTEMLL